MKYQYLELRISDELYKRLNDKARETKVTRGEYLKRLIEKDTGLEDLNNELDVISEKTENRTIL